MEVGSAVRFQAANLPIEDRRISLDRVGDFFCELGPRLEPMAITGDQRAPMAAHVRERTEAV